nr:SurA N-terminal domain-containing protein [Rhodoferax sp.]
MFDFVRKHTRIMMAMLFLLIIPAFVLVGIDGYSNLGEKGATVARVGSHDITQGEWDAAHKSESDRLRASMPNLDVKLLDSPEARYATLERLVHERVLAQAADKFNLMTSDARLARDLQENPTIASLRLPDGKLDMERYRQLAASQGLTPEGFEARVRHDLSVRQVEAGVTSTGFSAAGVADLSISAFFEKREVQIASFATADFASKISPTETELETFYKANQALFQSPEQASIEYVVLDLDSVKKSISISESDLKSYYDQNAARLSGNEERRASHILINAAKDATAADRQKARARADELLQAVRKSPNSFADVAKKNSQDTGSAANGGDLDFFARGAMVKPFEDAAFALKKGDVSEVVESDFGFHIIQLTDIKTPTQRSFEELRAGIEADLKIQQAQRKFAETAEAFTNGVYEQSDSLKPVADKLKLEVKTVANVMRKPAPGATGVLTNAKFLAAIFGSDAVEKKRNTEAVETAPNQLTAGRITQYTPARTMPFADVRSVVRERVVAARAAGLAKKEGMEKLTLWKAAPASATLSTALLVSRDQSQNIAPQVLAAALRADASALPVFVGVDLGAQGYAVVRVNKIVPRLAPAEATVKQERAQYAQWWTGAENQAYYGLLKERFKAQTMVAQPALTATDVPLTSAK